MNKLKNFVNKLYLNAKENKKVSIIVICVILILIISIIFYKLNGIHIANRRLNKDGSYSGVEYYSKTK